MARLLRRQGYAGTAFQDIVAEARAPIGSLYFHFPGGKAALAAEALARAGGDLGERLSRLLAAVSAPDALEAIAAAMGQDLERSRWRRGCPIATTALERCADDEGIRRAAGAVFRSWELLFSRRLVRDGFPPEPARRLGVLMVSSLEGALILARSQRSTAPLQESARSLAELVRRAVPQPQRRRSRAAR